MLMNLTNYQLECQFKTQATAIDLIFFLPNTIDSTDDNATLSVFIIKIRFLKMSESNQSLMQLVEKLH